jgi:Uma2 family endonuclease
MSWEEFLELPHPPKAEWVNGEVVIDMAPVVFSHGDAVGRLLVLLAPLFPDHFLVTEVGLRLPRNRLRAPDLMMVADRPDGDWVTATPALVAEVLSRSTRSEDTIRKSMEYAEAGVGQYWVVDPELRAIDLWHNVEGEWELLARVDDDHPAAEVELAGVAVPIDLRQILRA